MTPRGLDRLLGIESLPDLITYALECIDALENRDDVVINSHCVIPKLTLPKGNFKTSHISLDPAGAILIEQLKLKPKDINRLDDLFSINRDAAKRIRAVQSFFAGSYTSALHWFGRSAGAKHGRPDLPLLDDIKAFSEGIEHPQRGFSYVGWQEFNTGVRSWAEEMILSIREAIADHTATTSQTPPLYDASEIAIDNDQDLINHLSAALLNATKSLAEFADEFRSAHDNPDQAQKGRDTALESLEAEIQSYRNLLAAAREYRPENTFDGPSH